MPDAPERIWAGAWAHGGVVALTAGYAEQVAGMDDAVEYVRADLARENTLGWAREYSALLAHLQSDEFIDAAFWPLGPTPAPEIRARAQANVLHAVSTWLADHPTTDAEEADDAR